MGFKEYLQDTLLLEGWIQTQTVDFLQDYLKTHSVRPKTKTAIQIELNKRLGNKKQTSKSNESDIFPDSLMDAIYEAFKDEEKYAILYKIYNQYIQNVRPFKMSTKEIRFLTSLPTPNRIGMVVYRGIGDISKSFNYIKEKQGQNITYKHKNDYFSSWTLSARVAHDFATQTDPDGVIIQSIINKNTKYIDIAAISNVLVKLRSKIKKINDEALYNSISGLAGDTIKNEQEILFLSGTVKSKIYKVVS